MAEPALIAIADEAARIAAAGQVIGGPAEEQSSYATGLRLTVAFAVGIALLGWCLQNS